MNNKEEKNVLVFGTFDPLHPGHEYFFREARKLGDALIVVVARDSYIREVKKREPVLSEQERKNRIQQIEYVDQVRLGMEWPVADPFELLRELSYEILVLGYDQEPSEEVVKQELKKIGKEGVVVKRLPAWQPQRYKSSLMKKTNKDL